jgi:hypothetical protein
MGRREKVLAKWLPNSRELKCQNEGCGSCPPTSRRLLKAETLRYLSMYAEATCIQLGNEASRKPL